MTLLPQLYHIKSRGNKTPPQDSSQVGSSNCEDEGIPRRINKTIARASVGAVLRRASDCSWLGNLEGCSSTFI